MNYSTFPLAGNNLTQVLFKQNEYTVRAHDFVDNVSGDHMKDQMPAYLNQAHLSTWYQDNPWEQLLYNTKYGVPALGGTVNPYQSPGHKPGNTLHVSMSNPNKKM